MAKQAVKRGLRLGYDVTTALEKPDPFEELSVWKVSGGSLQEVKSPSLEDVRESVIRELSVVQFLGDHEACLLADKGWSYRDLKGVNSPDYVKRLTVPEPDDTCVKTKGYQKPMLKRNTARAFSTAFFRFQDLSFYDKLRLEHLIPQRITQRVAENVYEKLLEGLGVGVMQEGVVPWIKRLGVGIASAFGRQRPTPTAKSVASLHKTLAGTYGMIKTPDVDAGMHLHEEPHWYHTLEILRDMILLNDQKTQRLINHQIGHAADTARATKKPLRGSLVTGQKMYYMIMDEANQRTQ
ncbi:MAG: hypothetical protein ABH851_09005 [Methanobacteriota archaeon]